MKLINFTVAGHTRAGAIVDNKVIDLNYACQAQLKAEGKYRYEAIANAYVPDNTDELYQGGNESLKLAQNAIDFILANPESFNKKVIYNLGEVKVEAPVGRP